MRQDFAKHRVKVVVHDDTKLQLLVQEQFRLDPFLGSATYSGSLALRKH